MLLLALVAGGLAARRYDLVDRLRGGDEPSASPTTDPATLAPPPGVDLPEVAAPPPVAPASTPTRDVDAAAVRRTLQPYLRDRRLGPHVLAEVAPLAGGAPTLTRGQRPDDVAIPASTTKVVTSTAALLALGPDHVFTTEVRRQGRTLTLVGGGDPYLERTPLDDGEPWPYPARADLETLAEQTAAALGGVRRVRLTYDDTLFSGPQVNAAWEDDYVSSGEVSPTSALWVDQGRVPGQLGRQADPGAEAARAFASALGAAGVTVRGAPAPARAPRTSAIATVDSAPLAQVVQRLLDVSDNDAAEVLLRHVGVATSGEGSIDAGVAGVRRLLRTAGVRMGDSVLLDGSGLSRDNRLDPSVLVALLRLAAADDRPDLRAVVTGLPVAGFTGSLTDRMDQGPPAGRGRVRAKTGTLSNVTALAGLATDLDGNVLVFVLMADRVPDPNGVVARVVLDDAAAALGACACS
ncbi:D-alanyl-D-alanine carboxypeptidase/D-alanyl-D-alanine endopeptidase [Nocardioides rubriscoriae]|uniref:D-alanyl-D-alanine carboxypeptidase/D-alanyl-D-alanine endopeptidase n=1 Tax=Nocardioides rubriscoriae TaxID=642762 RepID=UPI00147828D9|nr:D-alanyl-D-alanine carboxypeptidase/D-alanyl-D-alanine-endopeptidase [Nocardioides rubriscoriae]